MAMAVIPRHALRCLRGVGYPLADAVLAVALQPRRALVEGATLALFGGIAVEATLAATRPPAAGSPTAAHGRPVS